MSNGWAISSSKNEITIIQISHKKFTVHPELLDKSGNITEEELLTVDSQMIMTLH